MGMRTTIVLVAAVGGLAAALLLTDEKPPVRESSEVPVLDGRSLTQATRIRWQFRDRAPVEIERAGDGGFLLAEPIRDRASAGYLRQIVTTWDSAQMRATPLADDANGRMQAGLEPPELTFLAEFEGGVRIAVDVGAPGPLGTSRFLRRDGKIWEGGVALYESMRVGIDNLRERAVFRNEPASCAELRVEQATPSGKREVLHLARDGGAGEWRLVSPRRVRADPVAAENFLVAVLGLRVDDFPTGAVRYPEREPEIVVTARGTAGEETVRLWQENGAIFGALPDRGVAFVSGNVQYSQVFLNAADQLRARILLPMRVVAEELGEVAVDPGEGRGDRLRLLRSSVAEDYSLVEPVTFPARATPCNELVQAINNLQAIEFVDGVTAASPETGLQAGSRLQIDVRAIEARQPTTLWFGGIVERGGRSLVHCCRRDEPDNVVLVPAEAVEVLRRPWTDYCSTQVLRLGVVPERAELLRRGEATPRVFRLERGQWVLDGTGEPRAEAGSFVQSVLRDLRAERAVDLRKGTFGEPDWRLRLARGNGDPLAELKVWDRSKDAPLVVQPAGEQNVGFELPAWAAKSMRDLWQ